jgi:hypothetical protein
MTTHRFKVDSRGLLVEHPEGSLVPFSAYEAMVARFAIEHEKFTTAKLRAEAAESKLDAALKRIAELEGPKITSSKWKDITLDTESPP